MVPSATEARTTEWVGHWGFCSECDGLTKGGLCAGCRVKRMIDRREVGIRPDRVEVFRASDETDHGEDVSVLTIPDDLPPTLAKIAEGAALVASLSLIRGDSTRFALRSIALGRDEMHDLIVNALGGKMDRTTVARGLKKLCELGVLERVGQLQPWVDTAGPTPTWKTGAYLYSLNVGMCCVGDRARAAFSARFPVYQASTATFGCRGKRGRAQTCLAAAVRHAVEGNRNALGHWLGRRLRDDCGLDYAKASDLMHTYQKAVADLGHAYTWRECLNTLESVYRRTPKRSRSVWDG